MINSKMDALTMHGFDPGSRFHDKISYLGGFYRQVFAPGGEAVSFLVADLLQHLEIHNEHLVGTFDF